MIELRPITEDNYNEVLNLEVLDEQRKFVAPNIYSLAQAWVFYDTAYPFAVYSGDLIVGFIMLGYYKPKGVYNIWRLMIDKRFQGNGYGKEALELAIKYLKDNFRVGEIFLSFEPDNIIAENLYRNIGFQRTGEVEGNEIVMCLTVA